LVMRYLREMLKSQRETAEHLKVLRGSYEAELSRPPGHQVKTD
jgi:hypothetical protein